MLGGGLLSTFAVGCPICNKIVVALGVSGALHDWPADPALLGLASVALLLTTLVLRLRGERSCPLPILHREAR